jgi:hypothetical protein
MCNHTDPWCHHSLIRKVANNACIAYNLVAPIYECNVETLIITMHQIYIFSAADYI